MEENLSLKYMQKRRHRYRRHRYQVSEVSDVSGNVNNVY